MRRRPPPNDLPLFGPSGRDQSRVAPPRAERPPADEPDAPAPAGNEGDLVLSVAELDRELRRLVERGGLRVQVVGEVSGLKEVGSGHAYFTLKDEREEATIDCVMYRSASPRGRRLLADGARIILVGSPTVYAPRGRLQFIASDAKPLGRGALLEALEQLKRKLASEGLFEPTRKRELPREPRVIGVVTSGDGAAIHDIVKVAFRRGGVRILLVRANVQGAGAAQTMVRALDLLAKTEVVEAIILGRGGGSADDLSAFNDERLVRKVAESRVPIISAVGHEIDTTLTDLAADKRAATPSEAAEMLVPDAQAQAETIAHLATRMRRAIHRRIDMARTVVEREARRLGTPDRLLATRRQALDDSQQRMATAIRRSSGARRGEVARLERRLLAQHPTAVISRARGGLGPLRGRLSAAVQHHMGNRRTLLAKLSAHLDALSPLAVLGRGYAIALGPSGRALVDATTVRPGDLVTVRLHRGTLSAEVTDSSGPSLDLSNSTPASTISDDTWNRDR